MNVFEKMKKSWENRAKNSSGFTLVELIVVIAILAILAGIAVPAYSGYVEKAERAEDEQLLATVNTAFAAACIENGVDMADLDGASMPLTATKTVDRVNVQPYKESFATYYAGNEDTAFNVFESIVYSPSLGRFCNIEDAPDMAVTVNGKIYVASGEDVAKVLESTWAKELTAQETLDMVAGVASLVQEGYGVTFTTMIGKDEYRTAAAEVLGLNSVDEYDAYFENLRDEKAAALLAGVTNPTQLQLRRAKEQAAQELNANIAVLVTAQNSQVAGRDIIDVLTANGGADAKNVIKENVNSDNPTTGLSQAALAYGLYNAYIYQRSDLTENEKQTESSVFNAMQNFDDADFQEYLDSAQGQKDLEGLLASLNIASVQNKDTVGSVVADGVNNENLVNALEQILGNK